jgi:queuine tRNA-ribosyltransferase
MEGTKGVSFELLSNADPNIAARRLGRLSVRDRKALETPNFIAVSSRGVIPHMTPDVVAASSQIGGIHMALEDCKLDGHVKRFVADRPQS